MGGKVERIKGGVGENLFDVGLVFLIIKVGLMIGEEVKMM